MKTLVYVVFYLIVSLLMGMWVMHDVDYVSDTLGQAVTQRLQELEAQAFPD